MTRQGIFARPAGLLIGATAAMLLWGSAFPFVKMSYAELHIAPADVPEQIVLAGYRFVLAGLMIRLFMAVARKRTGGGLAASRSSPPRGWSDRLRDPRTLSTAWLVTIVALFQTFLQYVLYYPGMSRSTGMYGAVISGTTSMFQVMLAPLLFRGGETVTRRTVLGLALGLGGLALLGAANGSAASLPQFGAGELLLLAAMFCSGFGNVLSKRAAQTLDVLSLTSAQMLLGGGALWIAGAWRAGAFPFAFAGSSLLMLVYLAFVSAVAFVLWNLIMRANPVGRVSAFLFLTPVFGVLLSAQLLGEQLHAQVLLSLALVAAGIVVVNRRSRAERTTTRRGARSAGYPAE